MSDDIMDIEDVYADIVGVAEIALELGVSKSRLNRWIERQASTKCPKPIKRLTMGNLYRLSDWRGWFALWRLTRGQAWR